MNNDCLLLLISLGCFIVVALFIGIGIGEKRTRQEAIDANVAEWVVDKNGRTEFKFKQ